MNVHTIFLHLDISGSGDYTADLDSASRRLSSELAQWASNQLSACGAAHAAHRGGDAVNAVFRDFPTALGAARTIRKGWSAQLALLKQKLSLPNTPVKWPGFRMTLAAELADISDARILDDNEHTWEVLTSTRGFPRNAIVARDNVLPSTEPLRDQGFQPVLRANLVRKGHAEVEWRFLIDHDPVKVGSCEFDGEVLAATSLPVLSSQVTITGSTDYALVTQRAAEGIRRSFASWKPELDRTILPESVLAAFEEKNRQRALDRQLGVSEETGGILLRLVADPIAEQSAIDLQVAPVSWELFSSRVPYPNVATPNSVGLYRPSDSLIRAIDGFVRRSPEVHPSLDGEWPVIGPRNIVPLGLEVLLVTTDRFALMRLKDITTTVSARQWDVSFSGYARFAPEFGVQPDHQRTSIFEVDLERWAAHEFQREVGVSPGNLEGLRILGVHRNRLTGALDLLAFLPIQASRDEIAHSLALQRERKELRSRCRAGEFPKDELEERERRLVEDFQRSGELDHGRGVPEREVRGARNQFVPFTPVEIGRFLRQRRGEGDDGRYPPCGDTRGARNGPGEHGIRSWTERSR